MQTILFGFLPIALKGCAMIARAKPWIEYAIMIPSPNRAESSPNLDHAHSELTEILFGS